MIGPVHVVLLTYTVDLATIDAAVDEHIAWLEVNYADGVFLASGRQDPRVGGVILATGFDRAELDRRLEQDPFRHNGLAEYTVTTFLPSRVSPGVLAER